MPFLRYEFPARVEAFSTRKGCELPYPVVLANQVHGRSVAVVRDVPQPGCSIGDFDALVTNVPGCAIAVRTADCVPVLLFDPVRLVVAAIHSGWRGTVSKITSVTLDVMTSVFGSNPSDVVAAVGPSICYDCFQVGGEVVKAFAEAGFRMDEICRYDGAPVPGSPRGGFHVDLVRANQSLLEDAGVRPDNILLPGVCTFESSGEFFSVRASGTGLVGRIFNVIKILE